MRSAIAVAAVLAAALLHPAPAQAQTVTRTWVSGAGDDANPCSRTSRCKSFAGALNRTTAGGEISVLDPGGYGAVNISKSVSIVAKGVEGGIISGASTGVVITAGANNIVQLDGLVIEGAGIGTTGIRIVSAAAVHIRNCVIRGFQAEPGFGINIVPTARTEVFISDCVLSKNRGGIQVKPPGAGRAQVFLDRVQLENNKVGLSAAGESGVVRLNQSTITNNEFGIEIGSGASVLSFGNNAIAGNQTDGAPSGTEPLK